MSKHTQKKSQWSGSADSEPNSTMNLSTALLIYCLLPFITAIIADWYWGRDPVDHESSAVRGNGEQSGSASPLGVNASPWGQSSPASQAGTAPHGN